MSQAAAIVHSTFTIERTYPAAPARVFAAFSDPATKRRWFAEGEGWEIQEFIVDFRVGGSERSRFTFRGGVDMRNDTTYLDIIPEQRIVLAYSMTMGDKRISASLATVALVPAGPGTRLVFTEQGAYFDDADGPKNREQGWGVLLGQLAEELRKSA